MSPRRTRRMPGPLIRHPACSSTRRMWSRSTSASRLLDDAPPASAARARRGGGDVHVQDRARRQDHRALEDVAQFAHVPGPVVTLQILEAAAWPRRRSACPSPRRSPRRVRRRARDVVAPLAQRRHFDREDVEPVEQIAPEALARAPPRARSRLVAAMMRTSTSIGRGLPRRSIVRSCRTRSSFTCTSSGRSPTSSRNSVEPLATSKRPTWLATARRCRHPSRGRTARSR